ncbi:MAG: HEPN domain-containing protein [Candidatus Eisenbacteria sp.]|nr:HEPN domain-containing protein [Candidatus Eisenbacteria bacterium]
MKPLAYDRKQKKRASTKLALALSELEAASALVERELYREAVFHLYFTCFYLAHALLVPHVRTNAGHKSVQRELHKRYGRRKAFPRRYIVLHTALHELRNELNYRSSHVPRPSEVLRRFRVLQMYSKFAMRIVPRVSVDDILRVLVDENPDGIEDFSFDLYCPRTYRHHTRMTLWQPPFYLGVFTPEQACRHGRTFMKRLRVRNPENYVLGLNSKVGQYRDTHLFMLDIDSVDVEVEASLARIGGMLLKTGRGLHFIGRDLLRCRREWVKALRGAKRDPGLKRHIDRDHIDLSLQRGYSTLRITSGPTKMQVPFFFKEF